MSDRPTLVLEGQHPLLEPLPFAIFCGVRRELHHMLVGIDGVGRMAIEYEGDLDVGGACEFERKHLTTHTPEYALIGQTFDASFDRVISLCWLPAEMAYWSMLFATAAAETKKRKDLDILLDHPSDQEIVDLFRDVFLSISPLTPQTSDWSAAADTISSLGFARVKRILQQDDLLQGTTHLRTSGLQAVLSAMITSGYAAVEAMAADLWVAALNRHPVLAANFVEHAKEKQLSLPVASGYGFNLSHVMGTILVDTRKVSFQSFYDIKEAFQHAFGGELDDVFKDVKSVYLAEKIRHLIAHRGGTVDAKFKADVKDFADYAGLQAGTMIPINGPMVAQHLDACCKFGVSLFNAVDLWSINANSA